MDWINNIRQLDIDISSYCNASCHSCRRTAQKEHTLSLVHFDVSVWKRLWLEDLVDAKIEKLVLNGNWGDSMMHKHLVEMLQYPAMTFPDIHVTIDTNGGMRNITFWRDLANVLSTHYKRHRVKFGIDGITKETNEMYRDDVDVNRVFENAQAFIDAGGNAQWVMTVFDHNVHELEFAKRKAEEMGFGSFRTRKSYTRTVYDPSGKARCTTECYTDESLFGIAVFNDTFDSFQTTEKINHKCTWYRERHVQIDPWGYVWPCCHVSGESLSKTVPVQYDCWAKFGFLSNNLQKNSIQEILSGPYFMNEISDAIDKKRWNICKQKCKV